MVSLSSSLAVVLGGGLLPDHSLPPWVYSRVQRAAELYRRGRVEAVFVCGGVPPGRHISEAAVMATELEALEVPSSSLHIETSSGDTIENAYFVRCMLTLYWQPRITLITSAFHSERARRTFVWVFGSSAHITAMAVPDSKLDHHLVERRRRRETAVLEFVEEVLRSEIRDGDIDALTRFVIDPKNSLKRRYHRFCEQLTRDDMVLY